MAQLACDTNHMGHDMTHGTTCPTQLAITITWVSDDPELEPEEDLAATTWAMGHVILVSWGAAG